MNAAATFTKTRLAVLGIGAVGLALAGCAPHFLAPNFLTVYQPRTKLVAIAPIANLTGNPDAATASVAIREAIYYELVRRQDKYTVTIQELALTDKRIQDGSHSDSSAARLPAQELCKLLGVDAVMKGSVTRYSKKGAVGQFATAVLFGYAKGSETKADVAIYDGSDGALVMQHNIEKSGGLLSSPDALRNKVGGAVAKKFPYKKKG